MAVGFDGCIEWQHHSLTGWVVGNAGQVFCQCLAGDGKTVAMQQALIEQALHQRLYAADSDEFGHQVFATGSQVCQHWHTLADAGEVIQ